MRAPGLRHRNDARPSPDRHRDRVALLAVAPGAFVADHERARPVAGALGPVAGSVKLIEVLLVGLRKNGPTLPPVQAQNRSTATPLVPVWNPVPPRVTTLPCTTTVSTLLVA